MALSSLEQNHISRLGMLANFLNQNFMTFVLNNYQWLGVPDFDATITQEEIDAIPSLFEAGVTVSDLNEMNYLSAQIMNMLDASKQPIVAKMANLP